MNTIEFKVIEIREENRTIPVAGVYVDGIDLTDLVTQAEEPFAAAEGSPSIAGKYRGLWIPYVAPPSRHFLGEPVHPVYKYGAKTQVLECECGEPGCWPLLCKITVSKERVVWSEFEQPHRVGESAKSQWFYGALGPFEFDREAYDGALAQLGIGAERSGT